MSSSLNVTLYKEHGVQLWKWYVQVHVLISLTAPTTGVNWVALETEPCFSSCASCVLVWCKWDSVSPAVVEQVVLASQVCYLSRVTLNFLSPRAQDGGSPSKTPVGLFFAFFYCFSERYCFPIKEVTEDKDWFVRRLTGDLMVLTLSTDSCQELASCTTKYSVTECL